jgi:hypothetical protein
MTADQLGTLDNALDPISDRNKDGVTMTKKKNNPPDTVFNESVTGPIEAAGSGMKTVVIDTNSTTAKIRFLCETSKLSMAANEQQAVHKQGFAPSVYSLRILAPMDGFKVTLEQVATTFDASDQVTMAPRPDLLSAGKVSRYRNERRPGVTTGAAAQIALSGQYKASGLVTRVLAMRAAANDNCASARSLDQFYTLAEYAAHCYRIVLEHLDPANYLFVESSAGKGAFSNLLSTGSVAYDRDPRCFGIETADFLEIFIESRLGLAVIGNPPFGKNASMAVKFFNHAASQSNVVAMIFPMTFLKASIQNRLDRNFHLVRQHPAPHNAFEFQSRPYHVPTVFQIWVRQDKLRALGHVETSHPDFEFTTADQADFAIQRVGVNAGRIHHDFNRSRSSTYFIRGDVEAIMAQLDFASVVCHVAGQPSLAKTEIVALYRKYIAGLATDTPPPRAS